MLSEEDKQRIKEEEIFRSEVQKSLSGQRPETAHKRLWAFFNTSLGIWVLSTIAVGLFGWMYAQWQVGQQNAEQIRKIDVEIHARIYAAQIYHSAGSSGPNGRYLSKADILLSPPTGESVILPEFANRNLKSLLFELQDRVPPGGESLDVDSAVNKVQHLESYLNKELTDAADSKLNDEIRAIQLTRWDPIKEVDREHGLFSETIRVIALLLPLLLVLSPLLYGLYRSIRWLWQSLQGRKQHNVPTAQQPPEDLKVAGS
jgi:hypothetical protein